MLAGLDVWARALRSLTSSSVSPCARVVMASTSSPRAPVGLTRRSVRMGFVSGPEGYDNFPQAAEIVVTLR
jgi:hypothetical protein